MFVSIVVRSPLVSLVDQSVELWDGFILIGPQKVHSITILAELLTILKENPFPPPYEELSGDLNGYYSRRINIQHRLVYAVDETEKTIRVVSVWSHYE